MDKNLEYEENLMTDYKRPEGKYKSKLEIINESTEFTIDEQGRKIRIMYFDKNYQLTNKEKAKYLRKELYTNGQIIILGSEEIHAKKGI